MNKTQIKTLNKIVKRGGFKGATEQNNVCVTDGYSAYKWFTDDTQDLICYDLSKRDFDIGHYDKVISVTNSAIENAKADNKSVINLPTIDELKQWKKDNNIKSDSQCAKIPFKMAYKDDFNNEQYIGFNVNYLIDFITITKADKGYIKNSISPLYFENENIIALLCPMRIKN